MVAKLLLTAFILGLPSLDVTAALFVVGALGGGARVRALMAFGCFCILGTIAFGTALSLIVGSRVSGIIWGKILPHNPTVDRVAAFANIVLGVGLLIWGLVRILRPGTHPPKPGAPLALGLLSLAGTGVLFALAAIADPAFVSLVVIAGRAEIVWLVLAAHSTWTLVSHIPLILVLALALSVDHERVVVRVQTLFARVRPWMVRLITGLVLLVGFLLLLDAFWFYVTGKLFVPA